MIAFDIALPVLSQLARYIILETTVQVTVLRSAEKLMKLARNAQQLPCSQNRNPMRWNAYKSHSATA